MAQFRIRFFFFAIFCISALLAARTWRSFLATLVAMLLVPLAIGLVGYFIEKQTRQASSLLVFVSTIAVSILLLACTLLEFQLRSHQGQISAENVLAVMVGSVSMGLISGTFTGLFSVLLFLALVWIGSGGNVREDDERNI